MKNIIITGTSRGIGLELVKQFASKGYKVLALSRKTAEIEALKFENVHAFSFDITSQQAIDKVSEYVLQHFDSCVDILIHNAGKLIAKPLSMLNYDEYKAIYDVNVFGVAMLTKAVSKYMSSGSHVVGVSSIGGVRGSTKFPGLSAYSSSKGALICLLYTSDAADD